MPKHDLKGQVFLCKFFWRQAKGCTPWFNSLLLLMKFSALSIGVYCFLINNLFGDSIKTYNLKLTANKITSVEKMVVHDKNEGYYVEFFDAAGESSLNEFTRDPAAIQSVYQDKLRKPYMKIQFDQASGKIISSGGINKTYEWQQNVFDGNGSLFYIFSKMLPQPDREISFNLLQSKEKRIVKMYLKYLRREKIRYGDKSIDALVYETGLVNRFLVFFWPYKYHYWYSADTHEFLRYEGPVGHKNIEIIEVNPR